MGELHPEHPAGRTMSVHLAPHLLVLLLVLPFPLVCGQAINVPGIDAWKAAIQQHSQAEAKLDPRKAGKVPGLRDWEAHQRAVLEAERRLEQSEEYQEGEGKKGEERVNTQKSLTKNKKAAILKLISKLSEKKESPEKRKSKVETLLETAKVKKVKETPREESFLDKLLNIYSKEEREQALESVGKDDIMLLRLEKKRLKNQKSLKRRPLRRKSHIGILSGDYLVSGDLLARYDDSVEKIPLFNERVRSSLTGRLSSAEKSSRNVERQLRKLLRSSS